MERRACVRGWSKVVAGSVAPLVAAALVLSGCGRSSEEVTGPPPAASEPADPPQGGDASGAAEIGSCRRMGGDGRYDGVHCADLASTAATDVVVVTAVGQSACQTVVGAVIHPCAGIRQNVGLRYRILAGSRQGETGWALGSPARYTCGSYGGPACPPGRFVRRSPSLAVRSDADCIEVWAAVVDDFIQLPSRRILGPGPDVISLPKRLGANCPA